MSAPERSLIAYSPLPSKRWAPPSPTVVGDSELRAKAEIALSTTMGRSVCIAALSREPSPFATLFPADVVQLTLVGGERLTLFVKYLGAEEADHPDKLGPEREVFVYSRLLTDSELPVVACYGCEKSATSDRFMLFLEYVDGWSLEYHDLEHWVTAARRLAALHVRLRAKARSLETSRHVLQLDGSYYRSWAGRALRVVQRHDPGWAATLKETLHDYFEAGIPRLVEQPSTFVHNDLSPKNVIADTAVSPAEIYVVDWEMAGVGCAFLDLVHLRYGLDEAGSARVTASYLQELRGSALLPPTEAEVQVLLATCDIHKCLYRLAHAESWRLSPRQVLRFLREVADLTGRPRFERTSAGERDSA